MQRRSVLTAAAGWSFSARAQRAKRPFVGYVSWFGPGEASQVEPLRDGLKELGWTDGQTIDFEAHFTEGHEGRTKDVLQSLLQRQADVIVVRATNVAHLAKSLTRSVPVVMLVSDPLATGLVSSLARPEGNLTGLSLLGPDLAGKRLEHLRTLMPKVRTVGFLGSANDPNVASFVRETRAAAVQVGVDLRVRLLPGVKAYGEQDFRDLAAEGVQALLVQPIFGGQQERIVGLAMKERIAVVSNYLAFAKAGALLTLGPDEAATTRRAAYFVHRLLGGARPGELPVEQPTRFTLALNLATARTLGIAVAPGLRVLADVVIE